MRMQQYMLWMTVALVAAPFIVIMVKAALNR